MVYPDMKDVEKIYFGRLQNFRRGLTRIKFKQIFNFIAGKGEPAKAYCLLSCAALDYRYRHFSGEPIEITRKELSLNPVFEFKENDKIPIGRDTYINGKRLRELFVTLIYACHLDRVAEHDGFAIPDKQMIVGYPEDDTGIDTGIFITEQAPLITDGNYSFRAIAGKSSLSFYIQVYFQYDEFQKALVYPKEFQISSLGVARLQSYKGLVLVYIRSFCTLSLKRVKADLAARGLADSNIILIGTEALSSENPGELPKEYTFWDLKNEKVFTTPIPDCSSELTKRLKFEK